MMRTATDLDGPVRDLVMRGRTAWMARNYRDARRLFEEALRVATAAGDVFGEMAAHHFLGNVAFNERRDDEAHDHHAWTLALARADGDDQGIATSLGSLAHVALARGRTEEAQALYDEAVASYGRAGMTDAAASLRARADDLLSGRVALEDVIDRGAA